MKLPEYTEEEFPYRVQKEYLGDFLASVTHTQSSEKPDRCKSNLIQVLIETQRGEGGVAV